MDGYDPLYTRRCPRNLVDFNGRPLRFWDFKILEYQIINSCLKEDSNISFYRFVKSKEITTKYLTQSKELRKARLLFSRNDALKIQGLSPLSTVK